MVDRRPAGGRVGRRRSLPGGPVIATEGGVPLVPEREGGLRADATVEARVVTGDYVLEFGVGGPDGSRVESWSPARRVFVR